MVRKIEIVKDKTTFEICNKYILRLYENKWDSSSIQLTKEELVELNRILNTEIEFDFENIKEE